MDKYEILLRRLGNLENRNRYLEELAKDLLSTLFEQEEELNLRHMRIIDLETQLLKGKRLLPDLSSDNASLWN